LVNLRDNIGWLIGSIGGVGAIILGYLQQYEFLGALLATTIGAGIAYFVQTKTQEKTWKREYALKVVEEVYAPLFKEFKNTVEGLEKRDYRTPWLSSWRDIQDSHKYLMVDEQFSTKMDELQKALYEQSNLTWKIRSEIVPKIFSEEAKRVFEEHTDFKPDHKS